jgi:hypothetical protein
MFTFYNNPNTSQGFTLFGLLLYIGLGSVVLTALGELTISVLSLSARADYDRSTTYALAFIDARIGYDIGQADTILSPTPGNPATELSLSHSGNTTTYYIAEGRVWIQTPFSEPEALTPKDVIIYSSIFEVLTSPVAKPPVRMSVQTGMHDPLRPDIYIENAPTTLTWYPYAYN